MAVTIYHNPACSKSREVLRVIRAAGYTPTIVEYVETGWTRDGLDRVLKDAGLTPGTALRRARGPARDLGLLEEGVTDVMLAWEPRDAGTATIDPSVCRVALTDVLAETGRMLDGTSATMGERLALLAKAEGILAL